MGPLIVCVETFLKINSVQHEQNTHEKFDSKPCHPNAMFYLKSGIHI